MLRVIIYPKTRKKNIKGETLHHHLLLHAKKTDNLNNRISRQLQRKETIMKVNIEDPMRPSNIL